LKELDGNSLEELCIVLIGDYPSLAEKEVLYSLDSAGFYYEYIETRGLLLILKTYEFVVPYLVWRCAKIRHVSKLIFKGKIEEIENLEKINLNIKGSLAVTIHSYDREYKQIVRDLERKIGSYFYHKGYKIDLTNPSNLITGYIKDGLIYLGIHLASTNRKLLFSRRPSKKPAFHPSSMMPENARLMVNLAKAPLNDLFVDPFCGVGGILIEAAFISQHCIGIDIDKKMLKGCKINVNYYGLYNVDLIQADALKIPLRRINSIACDTPYGIASSLKKREHEKLVYDFLRNLKEYGKLRICIATTLEDLEPEGFKIILKYPQKVRESLIRWLYVLELYDRDRFLGYIGE
jgi:tRNA (guanine10-N2)-dimethyltransferase